MKLNVFVALGLALMVGFAWAEPNVKVSWKNPPFRGTEGFVAKGSENLVSPTKGFTVSAWVCPKDGGVNQMFVDMGAANEDFSFYVFRGQVRMLVAHGDTDKYAYACATLPQSKVWTHYLGSYDGRTIRIWRNGKLEGEKTAVCKRGAFTHPVVVGLLPESQDRMFVGALAGVRLWNRALTAEEATAVYAGTDPAGLVASWEPSLDDGEDPNLQEMSGTSFFCYAMMWGINNGILPEAEYLPTVKRAWCAMCRNVADDGKFGWVQQIGAAPVYNIGPDSTEVYAVGAYLLSAAEIQRYLQRTR